MLELRDFDLWSVTDADMLSPFTVVIAQTEMLCRATIGYRRVQCPKARQKKKPQGRTTAETDVRQLYELQENQENGL